MDFKNLDWYAARAAQKIIIDSKSKTEKSYEENLITKTLGVLQENGVYAGMLFLFSRSADSEGAIKSALISELLQLLAALGINPPSDIGENNAEKTLDFLLNRVCIDLDMLLLVKQVWEQALIYARYGSKARG